MIGQTIKSQVFVAWKKLTQVNGGAVKHTKYRAIT